MPAHLPSSRIKVLQVIDNLGTGGGQFVLLHLVRGFDPSVFDVRTVSLGPRQNSQVERELLDAGFHVDFLDKKLGFRPEAIVRLDRVVREFRPDVVHTHLGGLRYSLPSALLRRPGAQVYTIHNVKDGIPLFWTVQLGARLGVVPVAIAQRVLDSVRPSLPGVDIPLIPNGIPVQRYRTPAVSRIEWRAQEGIDPSDFVFVFVARMQEQKNHELLLRVFSRLAVTSPPVRLLLAGDGELRANLEKTAQELGCAGRIHFLGNRKDVPDLLGASDAFVLSSDWEGNPLCILEAMAAGLPVVSTAVGGIPELVEHEQTGLLVPPKDGDALLGAMSRLVTNPQLVRDLGAAAARHADETFDVRHMADAYAALYRKLLRRS